MVEYLSSGRSVKLEQPESPKAGALKLPNMCRDDT